MYKIYLYLYNFKHNISSPNIYPQYNIYIPNFIMFYMMLLWHSFRIIYATFFS